MDTHLDHASIPPAPIPHARATPLLSDGGLETTLVFHEGHDLPCFAAYPLVLDPIWRTWLTEYYDRHAALAAAAGTGFVFETTTWRASPDWAARLGHDRATLTRAIEASVQQGHELRDRWAPGTPIVVSGCLGPRGDGYVVDRAMTAEEAADYHSFQIGVLARAGVDRITAMTIGDVEEAVGITTAAAAVGLPVIISFTLETDGRLPSGWALADALGAVDERTGGTPLGFMVNCAHPTHFRGVLEPVAPWVERIVGIRANASTRSHAELDESTDLDIGDPVDLAERYRELLGVLPGLAMVGGCCGTDERHIRAIAAAIHGVSA